LSAHHFVHFDQNHDQIGNRARGERLEHLVGLDAAKVSVGLLLTAPYLPMLFMGEEWATSSPFLYFADHDDEEMRKSVAEGRKNEFAAFGFDGDVPDPEDNESYQKSKLKWEEQGEGKHVEMLAWVKALIKLRRNTVCLNDGDMHRLEVSSNEEAGTLVMVREAVRVFVNFGNKPYTFALLETEKLELISREGVVPRDGYLDLPPMTLAVLMSTMESVENRSVEARRR
jgi:maltooligosyltrehalose trehalohydrolase